MEASFRTSYTSIVYEGNGLRHIPFVLLSIPKHRDWHGPQCRSGENGCEDMDSKTPSEL
jgi:hypothetical protein